MAGQTRWCAFVSLCLASGCSDSQSVSADTTQGGSSTSGTSTSSESSDSSVTTGSEGGEVTTTTTGTAPIETLEVRFLGVGGFSLRAGDDHVLTAPLFTNPSFIDVNLGEIVSNPAAIDTYLEPGFVSDVSAILVGHAHYDHLMDVPYVWTKTDDAVVYGSVSMRNLMNGTPELPDANVVVLNDPDDPLVDMRGCAEPDPCTGVEAGLAGDWAAVPGADVRVRGLCSKHPPQFLGVIHFGEGCVDQPFDALPTNAEMWREGATMAYMIDFMDPVGDDIAFRVYYQDAPTNAPVGHADPEILDERRVDLAILNVGTYDAVDDHPAESIGIVQPRYVIAGHWENFFIPPEPPIEPIPFHAAPEMFDINALDAIGNESETPVVVDGATEDARYWRPVPGTDFVFERSD